MKSLQIKHTAWKQIDKSETKCSKGSQFHKLSQNGTDTHKKIVLNM